MFTFETRWPKPFISDWQRSSRRWTDIDSAAAAMAVWAAINLENGTQVVVRLVKMEEGA